MTLIRLARMRRTTLLLTFCLALGGCQSTMAPIAFCTAPPSVSVVATVTDSVTGVPVADSATGAIQGGAYLDSLHFVPFTSELEAGNRVAPSPSPSTAPATKPGSGAEYECRSRVPAAT